MNILFLSSVSKVVAFLLQQDATNIKIKSCLQLHIRNDKRFWHILWESETGCRTLTVPIKHEEIPDLELNLFEKVSREVKN